MMLHLQSLTITSQSLQFPNRRFRCRAAVESFVAGRKTASLYELLRVKKTASSLEIKASYRNLAKIYHPDATAADSDAHHFMEIHNAYQTLSDPTARALYDLSLDSDSRSSLGSYSTRRWETDQCW